MFAVPGPFTEGLASPAHTALTEERHTFCLDGCGALGQPGTRESRDCGPGRASDVWVNALVKKT
jgi:hypothetical protein